jgi:hypothetical protein
MSEYIESLTMYASNACTEVLSGIEHQLERTLQGPCEKVAEKVARLLTEESDPSALSKVDGSVVPRSACCRRHRRCWPRQRQASRSLVAFLKRCATATSLSRLMRLINWVSRATTRLAVLSTLPFSHARLPLLWH